MGLLGRAVTNAVMDWADKLSLIGVSVAFIIIIFSLRRSFAVGTVIGFATLITLTLYGYRAAVGGLALSMVFLFPGASFQLPYGRDSNVAAYISNQVALTGWPPTGVDIGRGFAETPVLHFLAVITGSVTSLPIQPSLGTPSIATLLPALLLLTAIGIVWAIAYPLARRRSIPVGFNVLPFILFVPLYMQKASFRRQTLAAVFFTLTVYGVYRYYEQADRRFLFSFALLSGSILVLTHHVASFFVIVFLATGFIVTKNSMPLVHASRVTHVAMITGIVLVTWQVIESYGGEFVAGVLLHSLRSIGDAAIAPTTGGSAGPPNSNIPIVDRSLIDVIRYRITVAIFVVVLAVGVLIDGIQDRHSMPHVTLHSIAFFGVSLPIIFVMFFVGVGTVERLLTYLVMAIAPITIGSYLQVSKRAELPPRRTVVGVLLMLLVLAILMVPPFYVTAMEPNYEGGEHSQRFEEPEYRSVRYIASHGALSNTVYADESIKELALVKVELDTTTGHELFLREPVLAPRNGYVILHDRNEDLYFGTSQDGWLQINPPRPFAALDESGNTIYSNGPVTIYYNASTDPQ